MPRRQYMYKCIGNKIEKHCLTCSKIFRVILSKKNQKYCSSKCYIRTGNRNSNWKGYRLSWGYRYIKMPSHPSCDNNSYMAEHRLVMEKKLNRYLDSNEIVHHKNHNKQDNRIENLEVMTQSQHILKHKKEMASKNPRYRRKT